MGFHKKALSANKTAKMPKVLLGLPSPMLKSMRPGLFFFPFTTPPATNLIYRPAKRPVAQMKSREGLDYHSKEGGREPSSRGF